MEPFSVTFVADMVGVAVFAGSGASAAVARRFDMFGVAVIGVVTALGGGAMRDVLIGAIPPLLLTDWRYPAMAIMASIVVFYFHPAFSRLYRAVLVLDAAGLALFTVVGTQKGLEFGLSPYAACIVGVLSGVGGGMLRDILTQEVPIILREDFYAMVALIGSVIVVVGAGWDTTHSHWISAVCAGAVIFLVRLLAIRYRWSAPKPRPYKLDSVGNHIILSSWVCRCVVSQLCATSASEGFHHLFFESSFSSRFEVLPGARLELSRKVNPDGSNRQNATPSVWR